MIQYINDLKKLVEENYDVTILDMSKLKNVYKIVAVEGNFCLKQFKYEFSRFKHILEIFDYFKKEDFDNILDVISTYSEKKYIEFDNVYFYMTFWIESRELNYSNSYDLIRAAQHIAKFHNYSKGFKVSKDSKADIRWMKWFEIFDRKINDIYKFKKLIEDKSELSVFDKIYFENIDKNIQIANESIENLYKFDYENVMKEHIKKNYICHHDLANHNILLDSSGKIYFIDFDYVILDTHLHDLGSFIMRCLKFGRWNHEKFKIIINSYKDVKHVSKQELSLAMSFILFPNDFWQIGVQYYNEKINWDEEKFLRRLTRFENDKDDRRNFIINMISKQ